jgi:hypothetical protein
LTDSAKDAVRRKLEELGVEKGIEDEVEKFIKNKLLIELVK